MKKYRQKPYTVPPWIHKAVQVLRPVERVPVSKWAEANRVLPDSNSIPGPWRNSVTPYLVEIMDAFSDEMVEEIIFVKPTQVGGTSAMENMLASAIAQDPAPAMCVYPSDDLAERTVESKLDPMIKSCKVLAAKYRINDSKKLALKFTDMVVYLTGANSPADLASTNIRYLFMDEVDKFPGASKKEADPVSLAKERTKTFFNRKIFMASTPTLKTGHIWKAKEAADVEKHYFVPCPHCGAFIELKFAQIKWPSKEDVPENADRAEMATYVCQECGCVIPPRVSAQSPFTTKAAEFSGRSVTKSTMLTQRKLCRCLTERRSKRLFQKSKKARGAQRVRSNVISQIKRLADFSPTRIAEFSVHMPKCRTVQRNTPLHQFKK